MVDPKTILLAVRAKVPLAALVLADHDGEAKLSAFTYTDETVQSAIDKTMAALGTQPKQHVKLTTVVLDIPTEVSEGEIKARFAEAVNANDMAYFYRMMNSKGGQG